MSEKLNLDQKNKPIRKTSVELTGLMMSQIVDDNLMQRYGTSLTVNMGREYQKYLDEKYVNLKNEFNKINKESITISIMRKRICFLILIRKR